MKQSSPNGMAAGKPGEDRVETRMRRLHDMPEFPGSVVAIMNVLKL